jgi:hypothetical protein
MITRASSAMINNKVEEAIAILSVKTPLESFINNIICGIISGNPNIAMIAAFCCALAAMAERNVNTKLRLHPPIKTRPMNCHIFSIGLPRKRVKRIILIKLINNISIELNTSFANTKSLGFITE